MLWEGRGKIPGWRLGDTSCKDAGWKRGQVTFGTVFFLLLDHFFQVSQIYFQVFGLVLCRLAILPEYSII